MILRRRGQWHTDQRTWALPTFVPGWIGSLGSFVSRRFGLIAASIVLCVTLLGLAGIRLWWNWDQLISKPGIQQLLPLIRATSRADPCKFAVVVADFSHDEASQFTRVAIEGLKEIKGIQVLALGTNIPDEPSDTPEHRNQTLKAIQAAFHQTSAQILIWGDVLRAGDVRVLKLHWEAGPGISLNEPYGRYQFTQTLELPEPLKNNLADVVGLLATRFKVQIQTGIVTGNERVATAELASYIARLQSLVDPDDRHPLLDVHRRVMVASTLADAELVLAGRLHNTFPVLVVSDILTRLSRTISRTQAPLEWANLQFHLGGCVWLLGDTFASHHRPDLASLLHQKAFDALHDSLTVYSYERTPFPWAVSNLLLGYLLHEAWEKEHKPAYLSDAMVAARAALRVFTPENNRLGRWMAQMTLGDALAVRGVLNRDYTQVRESLTAYQDAIALYPMDRCPTNWASAQVNMGHALLALGSEEHNASLVRDAAARAYSVVNLQSAAIAAQKRTDASRLWLNSQRALASLDSNGPNPAR